MFVGTIVFIGAPETARWWWGIPQLSDWATETTIRPLPTPPSGVAPGSNIAAPKIILKNSYVGKIGQDIIHNPPDNLQLELDNTRLEGAGRDFYHGAPAAGVPDPGCAYNDTGKHNTIIVGNMTTRGVPCITKSEGEHGAGNIKRLDMQK
jgi:hypothetical protein